MDSHITSCGLMGDEMMSLTVSSQLTGQVLATPSESSLDSKVKENSSTAYECLYCTTKRETVYASK